MLGLTGITLEGIWAGAMPLQGEMAENLLETKPVLNVIFTLSI